jgi:hypothetical protein
MQIFGTLKQVVFIEILGFKGLKQITTTLFLLSLKAILFNSFHNHSVTQLYISSAVEKVTSRNKNIWEELISYFRFTTI